MDLARYVVDAVALEGRSYRDVARAHGMSKSWVGKIVGRFREGGYEAIEPRSRAPKRIPHRTPDGLEDEIVALRKELADLGVDAGAQTIHYHLALGHAQVPSVSTIWRVLRRRGFVTPQPHKRPRSSWVRFEAQLPNECWQSDVTHWRLADETEVEIVNFIDDHSRLAVASQVLALATAPKVLEVFSGSGGTLGVACGAAHGQRLRLHDLAPGRAQRDADRAARPRHRLPSLPPLSPPDLRQGRAVPPDDEDVRFVAYYNEVRPHRACGRKPPLVAFEARDKARPSGPKIRIGAGVRVRKDRIDKNGKVTLRHRTRLHHIGIGHAHKGRRVIMLVDGLDVRVLAEDGELLRHVTLDPTRDYQPQG